MRNKVIVVVMSLTLIIFGSIFIVSINDEKELEEEINNLEAVVLTNSTDYLTIQDKDNIIYTIAFQDETITVGTKLVISYIGSLNKNIELQKIKVVGYEEEIVLNEDGINKAWLDNGIFSQYYILANNKLKTMTLREKIAQLFLVRYPDDTTAVSIQKKYQFGGYTFYEKDFKGKTEDEIKEMIDNVQSVSKIPMLTTVDEEGGTVVRVSSNTNLVATPFASPSDLYNEGGFDLIASDTIKKSTILSNLGLNLNLAPVVDVSTDSSDYIYNRSLQQNTILTAEYAKVVIEASKNSNVSYTLKHFPGYGSNGDTHSGEVIDNRSYASIVQKDFPPFEVGIEAGAEAVLVSHNIVVNIDQDNPASLSPTIHNLLRNELDFTGVIITDDLDMGAIADIEGATIKAILAGNDLIMVTDYETSINATINAVEDGTISENLIDKLAFRVLAWKYYKGLMYENQK